MLANLFPLLRQLVDWFENSVSKRRAMLEVRFGELEMELSSSKNPMEIEEDITAFGPLEIRAFHALREVCGLNTDALSRFKDRFQFPKRVWVHLPQRGGTSFSLFARGGVLLRGRLPVRANSPSTPSSWSL